MSPAILPGRRSQRGRAAAIRPVIRRGMIWMNTFLTPEAHGTTPPTVHMRTSWSGSATPCARPLNSSIESTSAAASCSSGWIDALNKSMRPDAMTGVSKVLSLQEGFRSCLSGVSRLANASALPDIAPCRAGNEEYDLSQGSRPI
jgi:hypothetical protein